MIKSQIKHRNSKLLLNKNQIGNRFTYVELRALAAMFAKQTNIHRTSEADFDNFYNYTVLPRLNKTHLNPTIEVGIDVDLDSNYQEGEPAEIPIIDVNS